MFLLKSRLQPYQFNTVAVGMSSTGRKGIGGRPSHGLSDDARKKKKNQVQKRVRDEVSEELVKSVASSNILFIVGEAEFGYVKFDLEENVLKDKPNKPNKKETFYFEIHEFLDWFLSNPLVFVSSQSLELSCFWNKLSK